MISPHSRPLGGLLVIIFALLLLATASAASSAPSRVSFPVEVGGALARYTQEFEVPDYDYPFRLGVHFGIATRLPLTNRFALQLGVALDRRGAKVKGSFPIMDGTGREIGRGKYAATHSLDYLCFPVSLDATLDRSPVAPYMKVGIELSSLLSGKERSVLERINEREVETKDIEERISSGDLALLAGVGVDWRWKLPTYFEVRYVHGLQDITEGPTDQRNRVLVGAIGVRL